MHLVFWFSFFPHYRHKLQQCHCARDHLSHQQLFERYRQTGESSGMGKRVRQQTINKLTVAQDAARTLTSGFFASISGSSNL